MLHPFLRGAARDRCAGPSPAPAAVAVSIVAAALVAAFLASPAAAGDALVVHLEPPAVADDSLAVAWSLSSLLDDGTRRSLESGVGADLLVTIELWRKRRFWFSSLAATRQIESSAWLDEKNRRFLLRDRGGATRAFASVAEMERFVASGAERRIAAASELDPEARYFVSVRVELRPLTMEAMRRIEWWMRGGEAPEEEGPAFPGIGLTRRLVGIAADLSGFGDRVGSARSEVFRPEELALRGRFGRVLCATSPNR
jgi:hypothetical protein